MGSYRNPGPVGTTGLTVDLNDGTLVRSPSPRPGPFRPEEHGSGSRPWTRVAGAGSRSTAAGATGDESRVIDALRVRQSAAFHDGGRYRLVRRQDWAGLRNEERYVKVGYDAGVDLLAAEARRADVSPAERSALEAAARLLAPDRGSEQDGGLVLLRVLALRAPRRGTEASAVTPSEMARTRLEETPSDAVAEEHWVGLELAWEDGRAVDGAAYVVIAPDGRRFTGVTDAQGRALVVGLRSAGQCRISFPGFDRSSLTPA